MSRWEPNARERLEQAALELYSERGFEQTTVVEIAQRAGLTQRTFFRHFADKREVLFGGAEVLRDLLVSNVAAAPPETPPLEAVMLALGRAADLLFRERHAQARRRHAIIAAETNLQERELVKLATLSEALSAGLRQRGVPVSAADLAADTGVLVFKIAFARWIESSRGMDLLLQETLDELRAVAADRGPALSTH